MADRGACGACGACSHADCYWDGFDDGEGEYSRLVARIVELEAAIRDHRNGIGDRDFCTPVYIPDDPLIRALPPEGQEP